MSQNRMPALQFIDHMRHADRIGAKLHRTHPADGTEHFFLAYHGEVVELAAGDIKQRLDVLQNALAHAIGRAFNPPKGGANG